LAVCCQNLPLGALRSRSAPSVVVGALFKKFGLFLNTPRTYLIISRSFLLRMRNVPDKICTENQNTNFVFNNVFSKIVPFMRQSEKNNTVELGRQMTIRRMRISC